MLLSSADRGLFYCLRDIIGTVVTSRWNYSHEELLVSSCPWPCLDIRDLIVLINLWIVFGLRESTGIRAP